MKIKLIPKHIYRFILGQLHANRYYNWYVVSRRLSCELEAKVEQQYVTKSVHLSNAEKDRKKQVVFICNGSTDSGGWADRLKGILSTYLVCKELGYDFRLHFVSPFDLLQFLVPNTYDWRIRPEEVIFERPHTDVVAFEIGSESRYQSRKQKELLTMSLKHSEARQIHVYCNAMFSYNADFDSLFNELFRPSPRLQASIDRELKILGEKYISVSTRFVGVLGDFVDTVNCPALPKEEQEEMIGRCLNVISQIHSEHPERKILVNSDSTTFLSRAEAFDYVYVIPGKIIHLDVSAQDDMDEYELYEKTLLDFFIISKAEIISRIDGKKIHTSGFPYAAARINNRQFVIRHI